MGLHLIPFIASFLFIWAYRQPDGKTCSFLCAVAGVVYLFYNYFIGVNMAFMIGPLVFIYIFSTAFCSPVNAPKVGILYIIAVILTFFIGYNDFWDVFALMATIFSTASLFFQNNEINLKLLAIISASCFVFYALFVDAYGMVITTVFFLAFTLHSIWPQLKVTHDMTRGIKST